MTSRCGNALGRAAPVFEPSGPNHTYAIRCGINFIIAHSTSPRQGLKPSTRQPEVRMFDVKLTINGRLGEVAKAHRSGSSEFCLRYSVTNYDATLFTHLIKRHFSD
jgi:hypothetical protein